MAFETIRLREAQGPFRFGLGLWLRVLRALGRFFGHYRFNSITRRIFVLNFFGVTILVAGILYLNQFRVNLIQTRVDSLMTQAAIIASAIEQSNESRSEGGGRSSDTKPPLPAELLNQDLPALAFRINPEIVAPILRDLVGPTKTRARIYDSDGNQLLDSRELYGRGQIGRIDDPQLERPEASFWNRALTYLKTEFEQPDLPIYKDFGSDGKAWDEVRIALTGSPAPIIRLTEGGETVISVAMPIQRHKSVLGVLMLTTQGNDIDDIIASEHWQIFGVAALVIVVTAILSWLLAGTIAGPMRRLAIAAERVRQNIKAREQIPDFSERPDEIGYLSRTFRDMTNALYLRLDAIECFAADVSHELKNPLASLRSAAGVLSTAKESDRQQLIDIIQHDVRRLDRLITDISDASRLDAELARETARPMNMANVLCTLCDITRSSRAGTGLTIVLRVQGCSSQASFEKTTEYIVSGHDSRLSQVVTNLLDNAMSFSPKGGTIYISARRIKKKNEIEIAIEDEGPGIRPENLEKIFTRFYTDRPEPEAFGQNSGLGLNISQQIIKAHNGLIWAENRTSPDPVAFKPGKAGKRGLNGRQAPLVHPRCGREESFACGKTQRSSYGARFVIRLPTIDGPLP